MQGEDAQRRDRPERIEQRKPRVPWRSRQGRPRLGLRSRRRHPRCIIFQIAPCPLIRERARGRGRSPASGRGSREPRGGRATPARSARTDERAAEAARCSRRAARGSSRTVNVLGCGRRSSDPVAVALEQGAHAGAGEVLDVRRDHRPPARAHQRGRAGCRRRGARARGRRRARAGRRSGRARRPPVGQVLDHVAHEDGVEGARAGGRRRTGPRLRRRARGARARSAEANSLGSTPTASQPRSARLVEQEADPAAEVEQAPGRDLALDPLQDRSRGRALPRLLGDVVLGLGLAVGLRRAPPPPGSVASCMWPQRRAADDVGEGGAEAVGGRDQPVRRRPRRRRRGGGRAPSHAQTAQRLGRRSRHCREPRQAIGRPRGRVSGEIESGAAGADAAQRRRAGLQRGGDWSPSSTAGVAALEGLPFELILVDDGCTRRDAASSCARSRPQDRARPGRHAVAQLRPPGGDHRRARPRARRRRRDDRRRPPGPARGDPRDARALARGRRRRLRGARERAPARRASSWPPRAGSTACSRSLARSDLEPNAGDFRLLDRSALDALNSMRERNRFLRGMTRLGRLHARRAVAVRARRALRRRDEVHAAAHDAVLARRDLVVLPRPAAGGDGARFIFSAIAFLAIPVAIAFKIAGQFVPGITTVLLVVLLLGGIQLITVGIIGEYLGRVYDEVKRRPLYVVDERPRQRPASTTPTARTTPDELVTPVRSRGHRRRRRRPRRRPTGSRGRARVRRLRALARARRPGGDARPRRRRRCSSATTTTCSRATARSPRSTTSSGMATDRVAAVERGRCSRRGRSLPVHDPARPAALHADVACAARIRMGVATLLLQRRHTEVEPFESMTAQRLGRARTMGREAWDVVWGPLLRGKFGGRAERDLDGLAVEQADAAAAGSRARRRAARCSAIRAAASAAARAPARRDRERRRPGPDRPPGDVDRRGRRRASTSPPARPDSFRRGHDPREFEPRRRARALRRGDRHRAQRRLRGAARRRRWRRALEPALRRRTCGDRVPDRALRAARARPAVRPLLLDQHRRRPRCRSSA